MSIDYNKFIENQKKYGCCPDMSIEQINRYLRDKDPYFGQVDNEDILLQIEMHHRDDLGKIRINFFLIKLKTQKYTIKDGMKLLCDKIIDYMNHVNCFNAYVVYGVEFENLGYLDLIPEYTKEWGFNVVIDKNMSKMEITYKKGD